MIGRARAMALALAALVALGGASAGGARANVPIDSFSVTPLSNQAGGHSGLLVSFGLGDVFELPPSPCGVTCGEPKDITVQTPPGLIGIPTNIPRCTTAQFALSACPVESQVGLAFVRIGFGAGTGTLALFNMVPNSEQAGLLAIETPLIGPRPIYTSFTVRTESDFGLEAKTFGITRTVQLLGARYLFWGVPGDQAHNPLRTPLAGWGTSTSGTVASLRQFLCNEDSIPQAIEDVNALRGPEGVCADTGDGDPAVTPYNGPIEPFLTNPTSCTGPGQASLEVLAYDLGSDHAQASVAGMEGCDLLPFNPSLAAKPTSSEADSPSGLDVELKVPEPTSPYAPSPSQIRATAMTLPAGFTLNSNAADGKAACTDAQARFGTREAAQCPERSKIGTLSIHSSSLPGALPGALYLGEPKPGNRYRVFLVADGFSLHIKLPGYATPDPDTGQVTVHFEDLPQAPFQRFDLHIFGGDGGPLATPEQCGSYPVRTTFTPWDNALAEQTSTQFFEVDSGPNGTACPSGARGFEPSFGMALSDNTGGAHTSFTVEIGRADGEQNLAGITVKMPPGFAGTLKGIPYCPQAAIEQLSNPIYPGLAELASPLCAASRLGSVSAGAGAGSKPFYAPGAIYLAGPYKGAPLSLLVVVPAVSGPYDLGNVAVRVAVYVDPVTALVSTVSDPLPQILEGIPLRARQIRVDANRPDFILNPTNCDPSAVGASIAGAEGAVAQRSSHYQVANCANLPLAPKLGLRVRGGAKRADHPALVAVLRANPGDANLARASVALPPAFFLENAHIRTICTRAEFAARSCPKASIYGNAAAITPILDAPLRGPVYLRSSSNLLPDLVMDLRGQVDFSAVSRIDTGRSGGIRSTFDFIPDIPLSKVVLRMQGGRKGLLVNSRDLCAGKTPKAIARFDGQNGRRYNARVAVRPACAKHKRSHKRHRRLALRAAGKAG